MINLRLFFIICTSTILLSPLFSQQKSEKRIEADKYFQAGDYEKSARLYQKIMDNEVYQEDVFINGAHCYENLQLYHQAEVCYKEVFSKSNNVDVKYMFDYASTLMKLGKNDKARQYYEQYNKLVEISDPRAYKYILSIEDREQYFKDSTAIKVIALPINSPVYDFNPLSIGNKLFLLSNRNDISSSALNSIFKSSLWPISASEIKKINGITDNTLPLKGMAIVSKTSEVLISILKDGKYGLMRYFLDEAGNKISQPESVQVESFDNNICYPTLNASGNKLIFASDAITGTGSWDLYQSNRTENGFSKPEILKYFINTPSEETAPYLYADSLLFFASDGQGGLGGKDIFFINLNKPFDFPENLGYPINTQFDETGFCMNENNNEGYFVSERNKALTRSDIFAFKLQHNTISGNITDYENGLNIYNVNIEIDRTTSLDTMYLADNGKFNLEASPGESFVLHISSPGYTPQNITIDTKNQTFTGLSKLGIGNIALKPYIPELPAITAQNNTLPVTTTVAETKTVSEAIAVAVIVAIPEKKPEVAQEKTAEPIVTEPQKVTVPIENTAHLYVQIGASRTIMTITQLKGIYKGSEKITRFSVDGWYKYVIGEFDSLNEANKLRLSCGVNGAFVVAYKDGKRVDIKQALIELGQSSPSSSASNP